MLSSVVSRIIILSAGVVYPAYSSYKSVKEKNVKSYIKWLMYWVVYAIFASVESIADMFVAWIPFYYEMKILILLWLVSPASRGSIQFYVRCLHPVLTKRENEIDACLSHVKDLLYFTVVKLFCYLFNLLRSSVSFGHGLILDQIKARYGLQDVRRQSQEERREQEEEEEEIETLEDNGPEEGGLLSEEVVARSEISHQSATTVASQSQAMATNVSADTPTPVTTTDTSSSAAAHSTGPDSKSSTLGRRKPLPPRDLSSYDRYSRTSYTPSSSAYSSSYSSASTGVPRTYTGSSLYDRYTQPTSSSSTSSSSTSRYSSSRTSSYSSRYSKR